MRLEIGTNLSHATDPDFSISSMDLHCFPSERASHSVTILQSMNGPPGVVAVDEVEGEVAQVSENMIDVGRCNSPTPLIRGRMSPSHEPRTR